jgi:hypothetical protein
MLDKLVLAAFSKTTVERLVRQELERLEAGGFVQRDELERLTAECLDALGGKVERARQLVTPVLGGLAAQVREALDLPSRAEVRALTDALARAEKAAGAAAGTPSPQ